MSPNEQTQKAIQQISEMASAGMVVEVDPDIADTMGAFEETSLTPEDADDARFDNDIEDENNG